MNYKQFVGFINPELRKYFLKKESRFDSLVVTRSEAQSTILFLERFLEVEVGDYITVETYTYTVKEVDYTNETVVLTTPLQTAIEQGATVKVSYNYEATIKNALELANNDLSTLISSMVTDKLPVRFDRDAYVVKSAMVSILDWVLQDKAQKKDISVSGASIQGSDVFEQLYKLKQSYLEELNKIKDDVYNEMFKEKNGLKGSGTGGGMRVRVLPVKFNGRYR